MATQGVAKVKMHFAGGILFLLFMLVLVQPVTAGEDCWITALEKHEMGFDFVVESGVGGPDVNGAYLYTYTLYRIDQGDVTYRDPSHFTLKLACESEPATVLIVDGEAGIHLSGAVDAVTSIEVADSPFGMAEPGFGKDCRTNGIKLEFADGALEPDGDGISYPDDPDDPVLVISFASLGPPEEGYWFVKGGRNLTGSGGWDAGPPGDDVIFLSDGGTAIVPDCRPPVPVLPTSWGMLKQRY